MNGFGPSHDPVLLTASAGLCLVSAFTVFRVRSRMQGATGSVWQVWVFLAAVAIGAGTWGAQLLASLAGDRGVPAGYDPKLVLEGLLLGVSGAFLSLALAWSGAERLRRATGGVLLTFTALGLHATAQAAERIPGVVLDAPILIWLSAVTGAGLSAAAFLTTDKTARFGRQAAGALLLGLGGLAVHLMDFGSVPRVHEGPIPAGLLDRTAMLFVASLLSTLMVALSLGAAYLEDTTSRRALARSQRLADATREGIAILGADQRILDCNSAFVHLCGVSVEALRGRDLWSVIELDHEAESRLDQHQDAHIATADGERTPVAVKLTFVAEQGEEARPGLIAAVTDLRQQRAAEARIRFLHEHDTVTGLPNRAALITRLQQAQAEVEGAAQGLVLLHVRVGNMGEVNSLYGHAAGDALLAKVADRLRRLAGCEDNAARLGGDTFAFFVVNPKQGAADRDMFEAFLKRATGSLRRAFIWRTQALEPQVRIGVAGLPDDSATIDELMLHAQSALQAPDEEGRDGVFYFQRELHDALIAQRALAHDLRRAIADDELTVFYQPQARADNGALCGFEALVRWRHPVHGFLPPDRFIGVAEGAGLIGALGEWVLRRACRDAMSWPRPVPVAVNLSPLQVGEAGLSTRVHEILMETGLSPSRLELEVTETALFRDYQRALDSLRRLKALGIRIAMDDFGTGFSSLSTLQSFPFDKIKIDKSFVQGVGVLERPTVIVRAVLGIGRGLDIPVVAEGVETEAQMAFLRDEECAVVQGYLIGRPGPIELHAALWRDGVPAARRTAA